VPCVTQESTVRTSNRVHSYNAKPVVEGSTPHLTGHYEGRHGIGEVTFSKALEALKALKAR